MHHCYDEIWKQEIFIKISHKKVYYLPLVDPKAPKSFFQKNVTSLLFTTLDNNHLEKSQSFLTVCTVSHNALDLQNLIPTGKFWQNFVKTHKAKAWILIFRKDFGAYC